MNHFMHTDEYKNSSITEYTEKNINDICKYIVSLEGLGDIVDNPMKQIINNKRLMWAIVDHISSKDHVRAYNALANYYLFIKDDMSKSKKYKKFIIETYIKLNKIYIRDLSIKLSISNKAAINLAFYVPKLYEDEELAQIRKRVYRFTSFLYSNMNVKFDTIPERVFMEPLTMEILSYAIEYIFKGYEKEFIIYTLLEVKDKIVGFDAMQICVWNMITTYILDSMERMPSVILREVITEYTTIAKDTPISARRLSLINNLAEDVYPNILSMVNDIVYEYPTIIL